MQGVYCWNLIISIICLSTRFVYLPSTNIFQFNSVIKWRRKRDIHCVFLYMENNNNNNKSWLIIPSVRKLLVCRKNYIFVCFTHFCWLCSLIQCVHVTHNITHAFFFVSVVIRRSVYKIWLNIKWEGSRLYKEYFCMEDTKKSSLSIRLITGWNFWIFFARINFKHFVRFKCFASGEC